jgi:hypothetical protein
MRAHKGHTMEELYARSTIRARDRQQQQMASNLYVTQNAFPAQLHYLLGELDQDGLTDISFAVQEVASYKANQGANWSADT